MYNGKILEIFKNPPNAGGLQGANGLGKYIDDVCGDCVKIYLKINENGIIEEARFKTMGSVGTIVASSVICSLILDMSLEEAKTLSKQDILNETGEYPLDKLYTINFALKALLLAIEDYFVKIEEANVPKKRGRKPKEQKQETKNTFSTLSIAKKEDNEEANQEFDALEEPEALCDNSLEDDEEIFGEEDYDFGFDDENSNALSKTLEIKKDAPVEENGDEVENEANADTYYDDFEDELLFGDYDAFNEFANQTKKENKKQNAKKAKDISEELDGIKATKILEESKSYVPVIETKIISDEELAQKMPKQEKKEPAEVKSAKAIFDSLFED